MNMAEPFLFNAALRGQAARDEPMATHVCWRTGGGADRAYVPADLADCGTFLRALPANEPVPFVGLGSNLLVRDGGYPRHGHPAAWHPRRDPRGRRRSSRPKPAWPARSSRAIAAKHGYAGAEFLAGIPGTVGGALAMNAGCYGAETWERVQRVITLDRSRQPA